MNDFGFHLKMAFEHILTVSHYSLSFSNYHRFRLVAIAGFFLCIILSTVLFVTVAMMDRKHEKRGVQHATRVKL